MTINEYRTKLEKIKDKRKALFKKINKCDKDITKLTQTFILSGLDFGKGDKFIATNHETGDKEYLQVNNIIIDSDNKSMDNVRLVVVFKRMMANWRVPRDFCWVKTWEVLLTKNYELPTYYWSWEKVEN